MKKSLAIGGALLALAAFASTADARMGGGGGMGISSHGGGHASMSSSMGSPRGSHVDMRAGPSGPAFNTERVQTRVKGSRWKHPIDSDNGGPDDPPKKTPKGSSGDDRPQWTSNGGGWTHDPPPGFHDPHKGWYDRYGHYHPPH